MRLALLAVLALRLLAGIARAQPAGRDAGGTLQIASCPRQAGEYAATLDDRIVLDRLFLDPARPEDEQVREAIGQQLKYLWGHYRNEPELHRRVQLVLSAEAPRIDVRRRRETPYGRDLAIAWRETGPHLQIEQPYQLRAVQRGFTRAADPALAIDYHIAFKVALCGEPRPADSTLPAMMPEDPWLMHWHVPPSEHRRLCFFDECAVTSPCNDNDYADLPHPFYHWYDWFPDRHGPDADGKPFDCRQLLRPGRDYFARSVHLRRLPAPGGVAGFETMRAAFRKQAPLRATVLIGVLDHGWKDLGFAGLAASLAGAPSIASRAEQLLAEPGARERGTAKFLRLLAELPQLIAAGRSSVAVEGGYLRAEVLGSLRRSGQPVRIVAYVGLSDLFGPTPPRHWPIRRRALAGDEIVIYAGHSGIGENFRLARIEEDAGEPPEAWKSVFARAPYQLIAFLSCYSYMYFGQDLTAAAGETAAGREFIYTGTDFTKGDQGTLAILDLVDQLLAGSPAPRFGYVEPADFLLVKRVDGRAAVR